MKVISLAPSNTEILYALGAEDDVVATTSLCNYPEEAIQKPSVGGWTNPKIERINEFNPDLILASDDLQDHAVEKIQEEGFPVIQVKPHSLEDVYESIEKIGKAVGKIEEAEKIVDEMKKDLQEIELEGSPRIYCEEWMDPPMVSGNWIPDLIQEIGGEYFIEKGRSREYELEEIKEFDPEHIIMNICGAGENLQASKILHKREDWENITAVKQENISVIDDSLLNRPGPRIVEGAKKIAESVKNN